MSDILTPDRKTRLIATQIEVDLRRWIQKELLIKKRFKDLVDDQTFKVCLDYCIKRKKSLDELIIIDQIHDDEILEFISFSTSLEILKKNKNLLDVASQKLLDENYNGFVFAKEIRNTAEHGRIVTPNEENEFKKFCDKIILKEDLFSRTAKEIEDLEKGVLFDNYSDDYIDEREDIHNLPNPEYEDTGWVDRKDLNIQLKKKLKNSNVISFIGDAGAGKTALAVKKCYEYLNGYIENDFEAIIYHSFKTEKFSKGEIVNLQNEVNTTDKFFRSLEIINHFDDPIKNLVKHLEDHKVLLLLDNLENVLDNNIINFLERFSEAEHKSKIFITSRIPIGHGDIPIKVGPFSDKEALDFFERVSKVHQIENITRKLDETTKKKLISQRMHNPLYIKLALNAVADGVSLERAFKHQKDLLNFSYLTIYKNLSDLSKQVIEILFTIKKELALASICDLLENQDPDLISQSIRDLVRKNILIISFKKTEAEYYSLRKEVMPFIEKNDLYSDKIKATKIQKDYTNLNVLESNLEINLKEIQEIPEGWTNFLCRKASDRSAIFKLRRASSMIQLLNRSENNIYGKYKDSNKNNDILEKEILEIINNLKISHKDFCEVYRVEGLFYALKNKLVETKKAFEIAIALQPDYPNIYNYYSVSLRKMQDLEACKENAVKAARLFPDHGDTQQNLLIIKIYLKEFDDDEMENIYDKVDKYLKESRNFLKIRRKVGMQLIRYHVSKSDYFLNIKDYHNCLEALKEAYKKFEYLEEKNLVDGFTLTRLRKSTFIFNKLREYFRGGKEEVEVNQMHDNLTDACSKFESLKLKGEKRALVGSVVHGIIKFDKSIKGAFIHLEDAFFVEYGQEKKKVYIPYHIIPKSIKDETKVKFKLGKFRTKSGKYVVTPNELSNL